MERPDATSSRASGRLFMAGLAAFAMLARSALGHPATTDATEPEQTAFAVPRMARPGAPAEITLPAPLTPSQAAIIRRIFADQAKGDLADAARLTAGLGTPLLNGSILADRLLGPFHHSTPAELELWLAAFGTQADAPAIRTLLASRLPRHMKMPADRAPATLPQDAGAASDPDDGSASPGTTRRVRATLSEGFAAWRKDQTSRAMDRFEAAARTSDAPAALRAEGAFWAARAASRERDTTRYYAWLRRAAIEARTFHGLLARRMLGWGTHATQGREVLSQADIDALAENSRARRAFALLQTGQTSRAEAEFRALWPEVAGSAPMRRALLVVAKSAGLTDLAAQLSGLMPAADGSAPDDASVPALRPAGGFVVDQALVYGITGTESNFNPKAVSRAGAHGLMQIMPVTARAVSGDPHLKTASLHDPAFNLSLGQRLLLKLAALPSVGGDLIRLLGSYNAGVSGFSDALSAHAEAKDPILFIDTIPVMETRRFVRRVLANSWIYAARLGLPAPGLDDLASGRIPYIDPVNSADDVAFVHHGGALRLVRSER